MSYNIEKGTMLLILKNPTYDKQFSRNLYYTKFITGKVIGVNYEYNKNDDESYKIYTVLGEDGNEYKGEYGDYSYLPDKYFFLTIDDYRKSLRSIIKRKIEEANQLKLELTMFSNSYQRTNAINNHIKSEFKKIK